MPADVSAVLREAVAPFRDELQRLRPPGGLLDVHTHLGLDEDGMRLDPESLLAMLDEADVARACVFPLHDPERHPAYRVPNDRVLGWAADSGGRLIPFCRLDPADGPIAEAERCLARGARGLKLHPRAQGFLLDAGEADDIFALAEQARVPILIHAGRGVPGLAAGLVPLALRHPDLVLILAHEGVTSQGPLTTALRDHPGVLYDTAWNSPFDFLNLLSRVPPERIVFGSDPPYGRPFAGLYHVLRLTAQLDERTRALICGGTMDAVLAGDGVPAAGSPTQEPTISVPVVLGRVQGYVQMLVACLFAGSLERALDMTELALAACDDPEAGRYAEPLERAGVALRACDALVRTGDAAQARAALGPASLTLTLVASECLTPVAVQ